jgi:hypothetical protein
MVAVVGSLQNASALVGVNDELSLDGITSDGRRVFLSITEAQAERLLVTLQRLVDQGAFGDRLPQALIIPHVEAPLLSTS